MTEFMFVKRMLCTKCQIREATVHITTCSSHEGSGPSSHEGKGPQNIDLCQECFETSDLEEKRLLPTDFEAAQKAGCRFCGGEPYFGGSDPLAILGGIRKWSFMCKPCAEEYYGFLSLKLPGLGDPNRTKEQRGTLVAKFKECDFPAILAELDKHMKQWLAKRKSQ